jgi:uncharacterized protein YndB with AHSA1/START domain
MEDNMLRIEQTYFINASPERVWAALTDPVIQAKWTGQPAEYDARVGGKYKLWTEYVSGEIVECDPPRKLAQTWKPNDWTIDASVVSFTLKKTRGGTQVNLVHENVQPEDYEGTTQGWNQFYVGAIKSMLEAENSKPKPKQVRKTVRAKKAAVKKRATAKRTPRAPEKRIASARRAAKK